MALPQITVLVEPPGERWWGSTETYELFAQQLQAATTCPVHYCLGALDNAPSQGAVVLCRFNTYFFDPDDRTREGRVRHFKARCGELLRRMVGIDLERGDAIPICAELQLAGATMPPDFNFGLYPNSVARSGLIVLADIANVLDLQTNFDYPESGGYRKVDCPDPNLASLLARYLDVYWERVILAANP